MLIVEDDANLREMLRRTLEAQRWSVEEAGNGEEALERIRGAQPAVILLDLMMPVMDGFELLAELHRRDEWRQIPVVVITAMDLSAEAEAFGCEVRMSEDEVPTVVGRRVTSAAELASLPDARPGDGRTPCA